MVNQQHDGDRRDLKRLQRVEHHILQRMFSGLLVLIPLLVTVFVLVFISSRVDGFVRTLARGARLDILDRPGAGVVVALVIFYVVGAVVASKIGRRAVDWPNAILTRIPIVKGIYGVAKQATDALSSPMGHQFSRVVMLEYPRPGILAMGFVTGHVHSPLDDKMLVAVYIPTVPNPTSGMLAFVSQDEITETDLTVEDAMKVVFSGGIVLPDSLRRERLPSYSDANND